ncbi:MAG: HEPN domain-containing protein [Candidatus Cloacimonetes bacterium]|nr:HEPN domain-containing protein [Candidatus Cloacimonadota bacterium]
MNKDILISYRLKRANEVLQEAEQIAKMGHWNSCVNRLYYSCFYAVNALLLQRNYSSSKHTGIRSIFNKEFVHKGIIKKDFGKLYNILFDYRQQSDYEDLFEIQKEKVTPWIFQTKEFINQIEKLILEKY